MTFVHDDLEDNALLKKERLVLSIFLLVVGGFMTFDIIDDWIEGLAFYHILPEILMGLLSVGSATYLLFKFSRSRHQAFVAARSEVVQARKVASEWQKKAQSFREGLTEAINEQLVKWGLTPAEQEICLLLLKGFSLQEIANLRETSERTVRQQASVIYKKSGLSGRIQLGAFFLEDLLAPGA